MNARQAAKAAAKRIEELEHSNKLYYLDVKAYNQVIDALIAGGSACGWCEDEEECTKEGKRTIRGCDEWMLRSNKGDEINATEIHLRNDGADDAAGNDGSGSGRGTDSMGDMPAGLIGEHQVEAVWPE
jgi:hypothetical protein